MGDIIAKGLAAKALEQNKIIESNLSNKASKSDLEIVKNNLEQKASKSDVSSFSIQLADKALKSEVSQVGNYIETTNRRIDSLVIGSGNANAEVDDAKTSTTRNKSFTTIRNRLEETEKDILFPIKNHVSNGNFANGYGGWAVSGGTGTATVSNGVLSLTGNSTSSFAQVYKDISASNILGHQIYLKAIATVTNESCKNILLRLGGTTSGAVDIVKSNPVSGQENFISGIIKLPSTIVGGLRLFLRHTYENTGVSNGAVMKIQNVVAIDLTETYGLGKEPPKEYMDSLITQMPNQYFEGTANAFSASRVLPIIKEIELEKIPTSFWTDESTDKTLTIDTSRNNFLFLRVDKILDTTISIKVQNPEKNNYYDTVVTNLQTGISANKIATKGYYQIDVSNVNSVRITSTVSTNGATSTLNYVFDKMPRVPYQIQTANKTFSKAKLERSLSGITVQDVSKGIVYASNTNTLTKSTDWGVRFTNVFTFGANIKRVAALENGNILVILNNGELYLSQDGGLTFTINSTFPATAAKLPHDLFGVTYYKNIVLFTPYAQIPSGDPGKEVYLSTDSGLTFKRIFTLLSYTDIPAGMSHIHSATYDPWENIIWVCSGDGGTAQMIFYSKDMGATWFKATKQGYLENQSTVIIPLKDCVLFTSDARLVGVTRYIRPTTGTVEGSELYFDMPFIIAEKWGKDSVTEVPIGSTAVIDYEKSEAYFGWAVISSALPGRVDNALNYGEVYTTDGFNFKLAYKRETVTRQSSYGIYGDLASDKKIAAKLVDVGFNCDVLDISSVWK